MSVIRDWFPDWIRMHQAWNHHNGWSAFEAPGPALVYLPWIRAFEKLDVARDEAIAASAKMAGEKSIFPEHHLHRLLEAIRAAKTSRAAAEEADRRRHEREASEKEEEARRAAEAEWLKQPTEKREARMAAILERYPTLGDLPPKPKRLCLERLAINEWRGIPLPAPEEARPHRPPAEPITPTAPAAETPLTASQAAILEGLTPGQRERFDAMQPGRRRDLLHPFSDVQSDPRMVRAFLAEIDGNHSSGVAPPDVVAEPIQARHRAPAKRRPNRPKVARSTRDPR